MTRRRGRQLVTGTITAAVMVAASMTAVSSAAASPRPHPRIDKVRSDPPTLGTTAVHASPTTVKARTHHASQAATRRLVTTDTGGVAARSGEAMPASRASSARASAKARLGAGGASDVSAAGVPLPGGNTYTHVPAPSSDPAGDLVENAGPVMHNVTVYLDFWLPAGHFKTDDAGDTAYRNLIEQYVRDLSGTEYFGLLNQYKDGAGAIENSVTLGGSNTYTGAFPHAGTKADPLTFKDIKAEVSRAATANSWTQDDNHLFMVFTGSGVQSCKGGTTDCSFNAYCAYHNFFTDGSKPTVFSLMPLADSLGGCTPAGPYPNDQVSDTEINVLSHEIFEAVSDPHLNGTWTDKNGGSGEIGDKCNGNYAPRNDAGADIYLSGHPYMVQQEWSNAVHTCAIDLRAGGVVPPTVTTSKTVNDPAPQVGSSIQYTISLNNSSNTGAATNLQVTDGLPSGYVVTNLQAPGSTTSSSSSTSVTVAYDTLAVHQARTITVTATVPNQPEQIANNCAGLTLQNLLTNNLPGQTSNPCAQTKPPDQQISATGTPVDAAEGLAFNGTVATFTDPDPNATASEYSSTITWGDGVTTAGTVAGPTGGPFTVSGTHTYAEEGPYSASVGIADVDNGTVAASATSAVTVSDAPIAAGSPLVVKAVEGAPFSAAIATFSDADPAGTVSDYTAKITWADGTTSVGTVSGTGPFTVSGTHTYEEEGTYAVSVAVSDVGGAVTTAPASLVVADAPLTGTGRSFVSANPVSAVVATFTDADPNGTVADYTATIDWGDGSPASAGTVAPGASGFSVSGSHTYGGAGPFSFTVKTHICDAGGACTDTTGTLKVTYMTGLAYGVRATVGVLTVPPFSSTGQVANSLASTTPQRCGLAVALAVVKATSLCGSVTTAIGPGRSTAVATAADLTIDTGILGVPVIKATEVQATSRSSCGSASGGTTITSLVIGGKAIVVTGTANTVISLPGVPGAKLVVNEQVPSAGPGSDGVLTVNGLHLIVPAGPLLGIDLVLASATSDIHNCP
jgi:uncharacterized repeat protein (TIGR01451 family)